MKTVRPVSRRCNRVQLGLPDIVIGSNTALDALLFLFLPSYLSSRGLIDVFGFEDRFAFPFVHRTSWCLTPQLDDRNFSFTVSNRHLTPARWAQKRRFEPDFHGFSTSKNACCQ